jgi:sulfur transfer complex TusBCD TusB component (DsrH family)
LPDGVIANIDMSNISEHIPDESNNVFHSNEDFDKETTQKKT